MNGPKSDSLKRMRLWEKNERMLSASSSVSKPLVGKEPARGGEEVRLPH